MKEITTKRKKKEKKHFSRGQSVTYRIVTVHNSEEEEEGREASSSLGRNSNSDVLKATPPHATCITAGS